MITGCNAVYYRHFGLDGPPFQFTPALRTLYMGRGYREALAALRWGLLHEPTGFTLFTCETGGGKTTLVHRLLSEKYDTVRAALIVNPAIGFGPLLEASEGVPRRINLLSHNAMLAAYSEGARKVRLSHAQQTLAEVKLGKRLDNGEAAGAGIAPGFATGPGWKRISRSGSGSRWALAIASTAGSALLCVEVVGGPRIHAGQTRLRQVKNLVAQPLEGLVGQLENLGTLRQTLLEALPKVESAAGQLAAGPDVRSSANRPNSTLHGSDINPNNLSSPEPASREAGRKSTLTASPRSASTLRHNHAIRARTKSGIEAPLTAHSSKGPTGSPSDGGAAPGNGLQSGVSGGRRESAGQQGREVAAEPGGLVKKLFHQPASIAVVSPSGRELKARSRFLGRVLNPNLPAASKSLVCQHPTRERRQVALRPPRWIVARCGDALLKLAKSYYGSAA